MRRREEEKRHKTEGDGGEGGGRKQQLGSNGRGNILRERQKREGRSEREK